MIIAGHMFHSGRCSCGLAWVDIRNTDIDEVGQEGIAHTGRLSGHEFEQIREMRDAENARIADAMGAVAAGAGR